MVVTVPVPERGGWSIWTRMNWPSSHMLHILEEDRVKAAGFVMRRPLGTLHFATSAKEMQGWEIKEGEEAWLQKLVTCPDVTKRTMATGTNGFRAGLHLAKDDTVPSGSHVSR